MEDKIKDFFEGLKKVYESGTLFINNLKENIAQSENLSTEEKVELERKFTEEKEYMELSRDMERLWMEIEMTLTPPTDIENGNN